MNGDYDPNTDYLAKLQEAGISVNRTPTGFTLGSEIADSVIAIACKGCGGWHPNSPRCSPGRLNVDIGLRPCNHCHGWHLPGNGKFCSEHRYCRCDKGEN